MFQLSEADQLYLLKLSRQTIQEFLQFGRKPNESLSGEKFIQKQGVFVTLRKQKLLRGCVGYAIPLFPLYQAIIRCSVAAATEDPRFAPLTLQELPEIGIEISVLSCLQELDDPQKIEIGTHGLVISHKGKRGLLLPHVSLEYGWDRERFLQETCCKAGLSPDEWQKGAKIECFSSFVFKEKPAIEG
jgi:AmmeMemoRadiSam system protein A